MNDIAVPDYLRELVDAEGLIGSESMVSATGGVPRISLKGKKFRLNKEGEEVAKYNDEMAVIIVGVQPEAGLAKTYYKDKYNPDDTAPPDCSSTNGVTPDSWISNPQAKVCADCPQGKWGSGEAMTPGKQAKACKESKILWVVDPKEKVETDKDRTLYGLNITIKSLKALTTYAKELASHGVPTPAAVVTKIIMDEDSEYPMISKFEMMAFLKEKQGRHFIERSKKREWENDARAMIQQAAHHEALPKPQPEEQKPKPETTQKEVNDEEIDDILNNW